VDSTAMPVMQEYNIKLDFTISTTNLHYYFHQHALAPRETVRCGALPYCCAKAAPRPGAKLSLTGFAERAEF